MEAELVECLDEKAKIGGVSRSYLIEFGVRKSMNRINDLVSNLKEAKE